jgi:hypothetical protein
VITTEEESDISASRGNSTKTLALGLFRQLLGSYTLGFVLLSLFALICAWVLGRTFLRLPTPVNRSN